MMLRRKDSVARKTRKNLPRLDDLVLHNCKLKFYSEQLQNLNFLFERKLDEMPSKRHVDEDKLPLAISVVERLIQRLVCGVGIIDPNFASKYLIHLHENNVSADRCVVAASLRAEQIYILHTPACRPLNRPFLCTPALHFTCCGVIFYV